MTKKKIIGLCIGAVVLAVAAAGVKEGSWLMKHRRMQNERRMISTAGFP